MNGTHAKHLSSSSEANRNHWGNGVYFSDLQLPVALARYGMYIDTLGQAGPMKLCKNIPCLEFIFKNKQKKNKFRKHSDMP